MGPTEQLQEQHRALLETAAELSELLTVTDVVRNAFAARRALSKLIRDLIAHLAFEDEYLYPRLLDHASEGVRALAARYVDEMGGLREAVHAFNRRWIKASAIVESPDTFVAETNGVLTALQDRIDKEDNELYPLAAR